MQKDITFIDGLNYHYVDKQGLVYFWPTPEVYCGVD